MGQCVGTSTEFQSSRAKSRESKLGMADIKGFWEVKGSLRGVPRGQRGSVQGHGG